MTLTMPDKSDIATGKRLRKLRKDAGLTQKGLYKKSGVSETTIARLERGEHTISTPTVKKLAKALDVEPGAILN